MKRTIFAIYAVSAYLAFLAVYTWFAAFCGNLWLPRTIDGPVRLPPSTAAAVNLGLVLMFGLQHSVMARPWFKQTWTRIVPQPIERATYLWFSSVALAALIWFWQPIDGVLWNVSNPAARTGLWGAFALGWLAVPGVSYLINHFDLFGLRQVWLHWQRKPYESLPFRTPFLYARVRHPLYVAWALAFWATPTMSLGHALLAASLTAYMVVAVVWEERDLVAHFGREYLDYQRRVPMFMPRIRSTRKAALTRSVSKRA